MEAASVFRDSHKTIVAFIEKEFIIIDFKPIYNFASSKILAVTWTGWKLTIIKLFGSVENNIANAAVTLTLFSWVPCLVINTCPTLLGDSNSLWLFAYCNLPLGFEKKKKDGLVQLTCEITG